MRVKDNRGQLTDLWVNYLALKPNADGSYAMTFYETRGFQQVEGVPTPYHNTVWREFDSGRIEWWDPEQHFDIDKARASPTTTTSASAALPARLRATHWFLKASARTFWLGQHGVAYHRSVAQ